jgi:hypothetical protein
MPFLTKIGSALKNAAVKKAKNKAVETAANAVSDEDTRKKITITALAGGIGCLIFPMMVVIFVFSYFLGTIQIADGATSSTTSTSGLLYSLDELEKYYQASENAPVSKEKPSVDLASTSYSNVDTFNQHIKDSINSAGYGTRAAVVAAGVSLVGDYIVATGKRLRYSRSSLRQESENEGIVKDDFYMDCSSFAWWTLYNAGFNIPSFPNTGIQKEWAEANGYLKDPSQGQAGDFMISSGHIVLIIGIADDDNYYIAHFSGALYGAKIDKKSKHASGFNVIDMEAFYNDASNKR